MPRVHIKSPQIGAPILSAHENSAHQKVFFFVVSGRAQDTIAGVFGTLKLNGEVKAEGRLIDYRWHPRGKHYRFHIVFEIAAPGSYDLQVTGLDSQGTLWPSASQNVEIGRPFTTTIAWPADEKINDYQDDFVAYGDLRASLVDLKMTYPYPSPTSQVGLLYTYQDYTDQYIWVAQFDSLPPPPIVPARRTYEVYVKDSIGTIVTSHPYTE